MKLQIGDVVILIAAVLKCDIGTRGVVYDIYKDFDDPTKKGASIIFENGNYDGFSFNEQQIFFNEEKVFPYQKKTYKFSNVSKLSQDFKNGYWNDIFV